MCAIGARVHGLSFLRPRRLHHGRCSSWLDDCFVVHAFDRRAPSSTMEVAMLYFLIFGLVVGALARFIVPGRESGGWLLSLLLGVAGSFAGTFLGRAMGLYREGAPAGFIMSLLG